MEKILAIKGDKERGNEVIALLEMLGGKNSAAYGDNENLYYFIGVHNIIEADNLEYNGVVVFTLDEFYKKYPYKLGDKVERNLDYAYCFINKMRWNSDRMCVEYHLCSIYGNNTYGWHVADCFNKPKEHKEYESGIKVETPVRDRDDILFDSIIWHLRNSVNNGKQYLSGGDCEAYFRELVKKVKSQENKDDNNMETKVESKREYDELRMPLDDDDKLATEVAIMGKKILPPDGYLVGKITQIDNGMLVEYVNKKPKYPKTYGECCDVLGYDPCEDEISCYKSGLIDSFVRLFICRDAYWKIAGAQMRLGKPWEPDWKHLNRKSYCIYNSKNNIVKNVIYAENKILAFPTEEMRDTFYENFKDLIEQCKELL